MVLIDEKVSGVCCFVLLFCTNVISCCMCVWSPVVSDLCLW
jgi:hypothetical protein